MKTFKDYLAVDYTQTDGDQVSYNSKKRHRFTDNDATEETKLKERTITPAQRMKMRANFRKIRSKIKLGIARSKKKFATPEKLQARAEKKARDILTLRLTKKHKKDLALGQKQSVEKQLEKRKGAIKKIAKKLIPILRKKDRAKFKQAFTNSSSSTGAAGA